MTPLKKILVIHTAFIGDIVLALPLAQRLRASFPDAHIAFVTIPAAANVLENHPAINEVILFDKRGRDKGIFGIMRLAKRLRQGQFDLALIPHRSLRSALLGKLSGIPRRIGFSTSAAPRFFTDVVVYDKSSHEIDRNISLLQPLGISSAGDQLPTLYPSRNDRDVVDAFLHNQSIPDKHGVLIGLAPGSVWNTKRWLKEHFVALGNMLLMDGYSIILLGGRNDVALCSEIRNALDTSVVNAAGMLSLLQSAELIRRCAVLVSNDSAPMHLAVGIRTPVVAIFGATVPEFGFAPRGEQDIVVGMEGLSCRPCAIHGGDKCPIKTFVCMKDLTPDLVYAKVRTLIGVLRSEA